MTALPLHALETPTFSSASETPFFQAICLSIYRNWRTCLGLLSICWLLAAAIIAIVPPSYESSSQVLLEPLPRKPISVVLDGIADPLDSAQADSRLQVVKSERLLRMVFNTIDWPKLSTAERRDGEASRLGEWIHAGRTYLLGNNLDARAQQTRALLDFMNRVSVRRLGLSYVIEISFRAPTARLAASVTNSITAAYLRNLVISAQFEDELLQRRLADVENEKLVLLDAMQKGVMPEQNFPDANARVISTAIEPLSKSSPKSFLIFIMATTIGIVGGLFICFSRYRDDRSIRTGRERFVPSTMRLLGICPKRSHGVIRRALTDKRAQDGFGCLLMQRLLGSTHANCHNVIGLVSFGPRSGTTHVVHELAREMSGLRVRPNIVEFVQAPSSERAPAENRQVTAGDQAAHRDRLEFGHRYLCASDLIDGSRLEKNLRDLASEGPVLIDLPALMTSFDALAAAPHLDMIVLVACAGHTTIDELVETSRLLEKGRVVGFVLNEGSSGWRRTGKRRFRFSFAPTRSWLARPSALPIKAESQ